MRRRVCAGLTLAIATFAAQGKAESEPSEGKVFLDWSADPVAARCMTREQVMVDVEATLGRSVFAARAAADRLLLVDVEATPPPTTFSGQIVLRTASGMSLGARELSVDSEDCKEVSSAFVLALSIMADLPRTSAEEADLQSAKVQAAKGRANAPSNPPTPAAPARRGWRASVGLGATGALDSNGDVAPGAQAGVVVFPPRFLPFAVTALGTLRSSFSPSGMSYALLGTNLAATICTPALATDRFAWLGCLGPDVTLYLGWGAGFTESRAGLSSTVGAMLQTYATYALAERWRLVLGIAAVGSPQRVSLGASDRQNGSITFYRTPNVTTFASIGVAADFF